MSIKLFITGTDTGIGKTYITTGLLKAFNNIGYKTLGIKPVASGSQLHEGHYYNEDALSLQAASSFSIPYWQINPFPLLLPVSPHIAAMRQHQFLTAKKIHEACIPALATNADVILVEGVGGWAVPINEKETMADFAKQLNYPVILVVGLKLGCLNHAILTHKAIEQSGLKLNGWIANGIDPTLLEVMANIKTLEAYFTSPCIGYIEHGLAPEQSLKINLLLEPTFNEYF